jgi:hypothetical protein
MIGNNLGAAGVRFCGRCGAAMDGSAGPLGRAPRANNQMPTPLSNKPAGHARAATYAT